MALLQRKNEKDKELLCRKDKEFYHRRGPSPPLSRSRADEHVLDDRNRKRDRRSPPPHGERKQSPHKERIVSPPHPKNRRGEQDREKHKGPIPQHSSAPSSRVPTVPKVSSDDAMGKTLH